MNLSKSLLRFNAKTPRRKDTEKREGLNHKDSKYTKEDVAWPILLLALCVLVFYPSLRLRAFAPSR